MITKVSKLFSLVAVLAVTLALGLLASCEGTPRAEQKMTDPDGVWECQYVLYSKTECEVGDWTYWYKQEHEYLDYVFVPLQIRGAKVVRFGYSGILGCSYYSKRGKRFLPYTMKVIENASGTYMLSGDRLTHMYDGKFYVPEIYYEVYRNRFPEGSFYKANVVYDINYETEYKYHCVDNYEYGSLIEIVPPDPEREGYTFGGWYKEAECVNKWDYVKDTLPEEILDEDGNTVFQETALYAKWLKPGDDEPIEPVEPVEVPTITACLGITLVDFAGELNAWFNAEQEGFYIIELPKKLSVNSDVDLMERHGLDSNNIVYVKYFEKNESIQLNICGEYAENFEISFSKASDDLSGAMDEDGRIAPSDKVRAFTITNSTEDEAIYVCHCYYEENKPRGSFNAYGKYNPVTYIQVSEKGHNERYFSIVKGQTVCLIFDAGANCLLSKKSDESYEWYVNGERIYGRKVYLKQDDKPYDIRLRKVVDGVTVDDNCELFCVKENLLAGDKLNLYDCKVGSDILLLNRWDADEVLLVYVLPPKVDINLIKDENGIWLSASMKDKDGLPRRCDYKVYFKDNDTGKTIVLDSRSGAIYRLYDKTALSTTQKINISAVSYTISLPYLPGVTEPQPIFDGFYCEL